MLPSSTGLMSTFRNISGGILRNSLFPPHGQTLQVNEEVSILGSPTEIVTRGRSQSHCSRALAALNYALVNGIIDIVKTPNPILYDVADDLSKMLKLDNGELFATDPTWTGIVTSSQLSP